MLLNSQIAMNLVANNKKYDEGEKTTGLLFQDFLYADNFLVILHGKMISIYDLVDKNRKGGHFGY